LGSKERDVVKREKGKGREGGESYEEKKRGEIYVLSHTYGKERGK